MRIGFYPGCSLNGTSREYNESVKAIGKALGIDWVELKDWNCCGATAAHSMNKELSLALPTRILALAEKQGFQEIVVPCASCYNRLSVAQYELENNEKLKDDVLTVVGLPYLGTVKVLNVLQFIEKYILDILPDKIVRPFAHQVACYYGCLLLRPHKVLKFDRLEDPQSMDKIMSILRGGLVRIAHRFGWASFWKYLERCQRQRSGSCHCGLSDVSFQFGYASFYYQQAFDGTDNNTCAICNSSVRIGYRTFS